MYINQRKHRQMKYKHRSIDQIAGMFTRSGCLDSSRVRAPEATSGSPSLTGYSVSAEPC